MPFIQVNQSNIHYDWIGEPATDVPTLVLLDGLASDSRSNRDLFAPLTGDFPILMIDPSNRGLSTALGVPIGMERQIEEVAAVIAHLGLTAPVWHASSSRSGLAYRLALRLRSAGMILESPVFSCGIEERLKLFKELANYALEDTSLRRYLQLMGLLVSSAAQLNNNPNLIRARLMRMRSLFTADQLKINIAQGVMPELDEAKDIQSITCPLFIMRGKEEMLVPEEVLLSTVKGANVHEIRTFNTGHSILIEALDLVFAGIREFMAFATDREEAHAPS